MTVFSYVRVYYTCRYAHVCAFGQDMKNNVSTCAKQLTRNSKGGFRPGVFKVWNYVSPLLLAHPHTLYPPKITIFLFGGWFFFKLWNYSTCNSLKICENNVGFNMFLFLKFNFIFPVMQSYSIGRMENTWFLYAIGYIHRPITYNSITRVVRRLLGMQKSIQVWVLF